MAEDNLNMAGEQPQKEKKGMKKGWKIALVSLCSVLGLVIVVAVVALWLVLTPARLTSIVNKLSDKFILCESKFDDVDLTLFKTFPYVGLEVQGVSLVNPMEGAGSDTLARIGSVGVGINLREYLKNKNIEVTKLVVDDVAANLYTNKEGKSNYDIFPSSDEDTTASEPSEMPELVSLKSIKIKNLGASYLNEALNTTATLDNLNLAVDGKYETNNIDAKVRLDIDSVAMLVDGDSSNMNASLKDIVLKIDGDTKQSQFDGDVLLKVKADCLTLNGQEFVNEVVKEGMRAVDDLLVVEGKLNGDLESGQVKAEKLTVNLLNYVLTVDGVVDLPNDVEPMTLDLNFATGNWGVNQLLAMLPKQFTEWQKGMDLDAVATIAGKVAGRLSDTELPLVTANLKLNSGRFYDKSILPYKLTDISADLSADLNLNENGISNVQITKIAARTGRNNIEVSGNVADLLGKMNTDATVKGVVYLPDAKPMMPADLDMKLEGRANLNLKAQTNLEQLQKGDFAKMKLSGNIGLTDVNYEYDTIYAKITKGNINVQMPSRMKRGLFGELLSATITASGIDAQLPNNKIDGTIGETRLTAAISDIFDTTLPFRVVCDFDFASLKGSMDSIKASVSSPKGTFAMVPVSKESDKVKYKIDFTSSALHCDLDDSTTVDLAGLTIKGGANYDPSKPNTLQQWSPDLDIDFKRGYIDLEQFDYMVQIPDIKFNYKPERCEIANANIVFGNSDFYLSGAVTGLEKWLSHEDMLKGDLYFTSNYTNVDDLLDALSGLGSDADTLEAQRKEDNVDTSAHPFIVPKDVDFTLHTRIKEARAFDNDLREVAGDVQIRDGVAVLNQVGFVCKAARMQLTGMYRTPRVNHIFVGMDFHLLDINIQELIEMIPYVDTLVPLLNDLEGNADFHLCAETYVNAFYQPKMSTLRGAAALTGQNLVVLDNKDIDRIAKLLQLKSWREDDSKIHVDSLDVAMTVFRKELEVYPFLLSLHKYQIVAEGRHSLSNNYDYHVEIVQSPLPVRLAVDVLGTMPKLNFAVSPKLRYKNLYRPSKRKDVDEQVLRLKRMIRESLEANVKESTREYEGLEASER